LETHYEPDTRPDFIKEITERHRKLLSIIRDGSPDEIAYEVREHIRRMDNL
jgi:DNA-binding FadR family transcriptional regulator